jgi:plasmid stabilization system protein ParE
MKKNVVVLAEAASDIERGIDFYNAIEDGVGLYFRDSIIADLRRLGLYFGEHRIHLGYFRALSAKFPYAIYYRDEDGARQVVAVLDLRRSPEWIRDQLSAR